MAGAGDDRPGIVCLEALQDLWGDKPLDGIGLESSPGWHRLSGQSLVTAYVEGLPLQQRLDLDALL